MSKKNRIYKHILKSALMLFILKVDILFIYTKSFENTIVKLYNISPIVH